MIVIAAAVVKLSSHLKDFKLLCFDGKLLLKDLCYRPDFELGSFPIIFGNIIVRVDILSFTKLMNLGKVLMISMEP